MTLNQKRIKRKFKEIQGMPFLFFFIILLVVTFNRAFFLTQKPFNFYERK